MKQTGHVVGKVEFRQGDGAKMPIPCGPVDIDAGAMEVTLSWAEDDTRAAATMPLAEFRRYVSEGGITLQPPAARTPAAARQAAGQQP